MENLIHRPRRLRQTAHLRRMIRETSLSVHDLIYPLFVVEGKNIKKEISSMPGCYHHSIDELVKEAGRVQALGIPAIILFGIPEHKDETGSQAYAEDGIIQEACRVLKKEINGLTIITDLCFCEYTSHGHCGIVKNQTVDNDATLKLIAQTAVSQARAGADMIAPSDMMDGRIKVIRSSLDSQDLTHIPIMAYSAKYASAFYGPFREAALSAPSFGDRRAYQMDPANSDEALREAALDIDEGADIIMVKPALAYLDIINRLKNQFNKPLAAYNVSGEYAMIKAAAQNGWLDEKKAALELLFSIKRAGADLIITYFAKDAVPYLEEMEAL